MQQNDFQHIPATFWVYILLPFIVIAATLFGVKQNPFMFGLIGVVPFCFLLVNRVDFWLITIFAVYSSRLRVPGLLGQLELVDVLIAGLIGVVFLRWIIQKQGVDRSAWMWRFMYVFAAVLIVTVAVRGSGFAFLGDSMYGGMRYVELILALAFPFVVTCLRLTPSQWKAAIVAMSIFALLPMFADMLFIISNGAIYQHYYVIKHGAVGDSIGAFGTGEMTRFRSASSGGAAILTLPFILFPLTVRNSWKYVLMVLAGIALLSIAGYRLGVIRALAFLWLYLFFVLKGRRGLLVTVSVLVGLLTLALLYWLIPYMPLSTQRAFSLIPFAPIDPAVAMEASSTIHWRINVWSNALSEIPDYLWIGKGYTYDPLLMASFMENRTAEDWARIQVSYHSGPLSLLIGMGIPGLITGMGILFAALARHFRVFKSKWYDPTLQRFHAVFLVLMFVHILVFIFIYGDVHTSFPSILKMVAVLEGLFLANQSLAESRGEEEVPVEAPVKQVPQFRKIHLGV